MEQEVEYKEIWKRSRVVFVHNILSIQWQRSTELSQGQRLLALVPGTAISGDAGDSKY